jgi:hypothetical protein
MVKSDTMKFTKAVYDVMYEIFEVANSWLVHCVHESLRNRMKPEEQKSNRAATIAGAT